MLPPRETNLGDPNGEIGISNSVSASLWYQQRQTYGHIHTHQLGYVQWALIVVQKVLIVTQIFQIF